MSTIRIAEHEIADKLPGLLARVQDGDQVVIQTASRPILVTQQVTQERQERGWTAAEALQRLANRTLTVVDHDFAADLANVREVLNSSYRPAEWD